MTWQSDLLAAIGAPSTSQNVDFLTRWNQAEGNVAGQSGLGINNPLNTTNVGPGSMSVNSVGVQSFPDLSEGVALNAKTIAPTAGSGWIDWYPDIREALRSGNPMAHITDAVRTQLTLWGTGAGWLASQDISGVTTSGGSASVGGTTGGTTSSSGTISTQSAGSSAGTVQECQDWNVLGKDLPGTRLFCEFSRTSTWWRVGLTAAGIALILIGAFIYITPELAHSKMAAIA